MRRLPVYFVLDVSESMVGEPIEQVQEGMRTIIQDLHTDPYALETVFVSVIAFAGKAHILSPLEELYKFYPPDLPIGDGTSLGAALSCLMMDMDRSLQKTTMEVKGDFKPIIFLFTDGVPTDDPSGAIKKWKSTYAKHCNLIAISLGEGADTSLLGKITTNVLRLKETDKNAFKAFFAWVTASIKTSSMSVGDYGDDNIKLAPTDGINLEKVDPNANCTVDENYIVLHGKCINTDKSYLIKYGKGTRFQKEDTSHQDQELYSLIGAYAINNASYAKFSGDTTVRETITSDTMLGAPHCPCCGNQIGLIVCGACNNIGCYSGQGLFTCAWCGIQGEVVVAQTAIDMARERG